MDNILVAYLIAYILFLGCMLLRNARVLRQRSAWSLATMLPDSTHAQPMPATILNEPYMQKGMVALVRLLHSKLYPFYVHPKSISFVHTPKAFYASLRQRMSIAKQRILLVSLYWPGESADEASLLDIVEQRCRTCPGLQVTIVMDRKRMDRSGKVLTRSIEALRMAYPNRVRYCTLETPVRGIMPSIFYAMHDNRFKELAGVSHLKMYVCDDSCLWTGANLSHHYFTNRYDRYMWIDACPTVASWCESVTECMIRHHRARHPEKLKEELTQLVSRGWCDGGASKYRERFETLQSETCTVLYPFMQLGSIDLRLESAFMNDLMRTFHTMSGEHAPANKSVVPTLTITSAYFNFTNTVLRNVVQDSIAERRDEQREVGRSRKPTRMRVVTSSIKCNSFTAMAGRMGEWVPYMYQQVCRTFFETVQKRGLQSVVQLWEWRRAHCTYHAKGVWLDCNDCVPLMTIGSSNLGSRSEELDLELNLVVCTCDKNLQMKMKQEEESILQDAKVVQSKSTLGRFLPVVALLAEAGRQMM